MLVQPLWFPRLGTRKDQRGNTAIFIRSGPLIAIVVMGSLCSHALVHVGEFAGRPSSPQGIAGARAAPDCRAHTQYEVGLDLPDKHLPLPERPAQMIRVVVADDHQLVREGVKKVLSTEPDIALVGEAADLPGTLDVLLSTRPDVLLLDLSLSPAHELDALRTVADRFPGMPVLVLGAHSEAQFGIAVLRLGACGYISKSLSADVLAKAIRKAHAGVRYLSDTLANLLAEEVASPHPRHAHERLTEREHQVLRLLAVGSPVKQVAGKLDISVSSVNTYRSRVFAKLRIKSNAELIRYAIQHALVS